MNQRGASLIEATASVVVAGLLLATAGGGLHNATEILGAEMRRHRRITLARNLIEAEYGAPCTGSFTCPGSYRCNVGRTASSAAGLDIVAVEVVTLGSGETLQMRALAAACPGDQTTP